jgi:carboxynorspermidine decarboxylase
MIPGIPADVRTPAYVLDVAALKRNLATAERIKRETGARILLATKAWAMPPAFALLRDALDGTTASGAYEARLGREEFGKEVHVYAPAYTAGEVAELLELADHIYFNSAEQLQRFAPLVRRSGTIATGIRVNAGYSHATLGGALYDPSARYSRFGATADALDALPWEAIDVFHVHALCEALHEGSLGLMRHVATAFAPYLRRVAAVNFGGGHFINKPGYDVAALIAGIKAFRAQFPVDVILEPGAGLVVDAGYLVASVVALHCNEKRIAILDASASCHMPDVLEVPYRPTVLGAAEPGVLPHTYILAGKTCMTGDVIGEYSFARALEPGDRLLFGDMMQYSFVKNTAFNGMPLPDIAMLDTDGAYRVMRTFSYGDFRSRLG